jgi:hypothetical protein
VSETIRRVCADRDIAVETRVNARQAKTNCRGLELILALEIQDAARVERSLDELATSQAVRDFFMCLSRTSACRHDTRACA